MNSITVTDLIRLLPKVKLIDIRDKYQYNMGNIPSSMNIPATFLLMNPGNYLNTIDTYYICCETGYNSKKVCYELQRKGYKVVDVIGGYSEYRLQKNNANY